MHNRLLYECFSVPFVCSFFKLLWVFTAQIKATLSVIEDERNRWFENFTTEQKARQELEGIYLTFTYVPYTSGVAQLKTFACLTFAEKYQKVIHEQSNLKNEKTHLENQYKNLQQRLEITTELYHQKENILHQ